MTGVAAGLETSKAVLVARRRAAGVIPWRREWQRGYQGIAGTDGVDQQGCVIGSP